MKKVLLVGENPYSITGNAKMLRYVLSTIDVSKYAVHVFAIESLMVNYAQILEKPFPLPIISSLALDDLSDVWGHRKLLNILQTKQFDYVIFVGLDIWRYAKIFENIREIKKTNQFKWICIFPYDLPEIRKDWVSLINMIDIPCVYSMDGYDRLKKHVPNIKYFRPSIPDNTLQSFSPLASQKEKHILRKKIFPMLDDDELLFGFFGNNQVRKNPQALIKAFADVLQYAEKSEKLCRLYLHTDLKNGVYNLEQYAKDCGIHSGAILTKNNDWIPDNQVANLIKSLDCLVNCTLHEGLSWTLIEAMSCGIPIIASYSSAHKELIDGTENIGIVPTVPTYLPVVTASGLSNVDAIACSADDIKDAMIKILDNPQMLDAMGQSGRAKIEEWYAGATNISDILDEIESSEFIIPTNIEKKDAVLFVQHSSAGDVLMTTKCFKGLKKRHKGLPLYYMTQDKYSDILINNPYLEGIISWNEEAIQQYKIVYNPHAERVLPGHWGRNCNSILSDFYWKILDVERDDIYIDLKTPQHLNLKYEEGADYICDVKFIPGKTVFVHTTGGDPKFRTYLYMSDVCEILRNDNYLTVQVGGKSDIDAGADIDLRGLSYRETAFMVTMYANYAITVDSFVSHLMGALNVHQICLFGSGNALVVRPEHTHSNLICMSPDYIKKCPGLGPCSGAIRDCPIKCTGYHDPKEIIENFYNLVDMKKNGEICDVQFLSSK